jgi:hypothetical protein
LKHYQWKSIPTAIAIPIAGSMSGFGIAVAIDIVVNLKSRIGNSPCFRNPVLIDYCELDGQYRRRVLIAVDYKINFNAVNEKN